MADFVLRYTASVGFDRRLAFADIDCSLAHAAMLHECGIIGALDLADIERGLRQIREEIERDQFEWRVELEDVHLNIERRLTVWSGTPEAYAHRPLPHDQIATDTRLGCAGKSIT